MVPYLRQKVRVARPLRLSLIVVLALVASLFAVVGAGALPAVADDGDHAGDETSGLKPALRGLVVTQPTSLKTVPYAEYGSLRIPWATLETSPGNFDFGPIDRVLVDHPDVQFRLRIMAGINAPTWVKNASGGCVQIDPDSVNGNSGCTPRFWTDAFHYRYKNLMEALAAQYETDDQVVEVTNSECTTIYSEPFILGGDTDSVDRLWRAGYTKEGHAACLRRSTGMMMTLFPTTRISLAGHTRWQFVSQGPGGPDDGKFDASWEDERAMLNELSGNYGSQLVLDDHGLGPDDTVCPTPGQSRFTATSWYCYMSGLHNSSAAYGWQFTLNGGSMSEAADAGVGMGACFLEFAAFQGLDETKRRDIHDELLANCQDTGEPPPSTPTVSNESAPEVTGTPQIGQTLAVTSGTWAPEPESVEYQWFSNNKLLYIETGPTYTVRPGDAGHRLTVRVTSSHDAYLPGEWTSDPMKVGKFDTRTKARMPKHRTHSRRPAIVVNVMSVGGTPHGRVVITRHGHRVGSARLHNGWVRLHVHKLHRGHHRLVAHYKGGPGMRKSRSHAVRVFIKR